MPNYPEVLQGILIAIGNEEGLSNQAREALDAVSVLVENEFCRADRQAYKQWAFDMCRDGGPVWEPCDAWWDEGLQKVAYVWIDKELKAAGKRRRA